MKVTFMKTKYLKENYFETQGNFTNFTSMTERSS